MTGMNASTPAPSGPLVGLRVLDMSTVVAGPFAVRPCSPISAPTCIKVEMPGIGDPLAPSWRRTRTTCRCGGRSPTATRRASPSICASRTARRCWPAASPTHDVLVENFRSGTLDQWGITRAWLQEINPKLTILRVTGFGQTGPYRDTPRLRPHLRGDERLYPDVRRGGRLAAASRLSHLGCDRRIVRRRRRARRRSIGSRTDPATAAGQEIDCSITEAMLRTLDFLAIEYDQLGTVRTGKRQPQPVCRARQYLCDLGRQMGLDRRLHAKHL